jgi:hypothetical protein
MYSSIIYKLFIKSLFLILFNSSSFDIVVSSQNLSSSLASSFKISSLLNKKFFLLFSKVFSSQSLICSSMFFLSSEVNVLVPGQSLLLSSISSPDGGNLSGLNKLLLPVFFLISVNLIAT